jgi:hypothetical protein
LARRKETIVRLISRLLEAGKTGGCAGGRLRLFLTVEGNRPSSLFKRMKISPKEKTARIDLGLDILRATRPGEQYCDCTAGRIGQIERKALARLRRGLSKD